MKQLSTDEAIEVINNWFKVPERVAHQVRIGAEKVRGGYVIIEFRAPWNGLDGSWMKSEIAKLILHKPSQFWKIYWKRASGMWELYGNYKTFIGALKIINQDPHGCFWG